MNAARINVYNQTVSVYFCISCMKISTIFGDLEGFNLISL